MKNIRWGGLIAFVAVAVSAVNAVAAGNVQFRHITEKQGLMHTWVQHITKDSRGYMWFSTIYGACRYDGFGFEDYVFKTEVSGGAARVNVVCEDSSNAIWFGTDNGLYRYDWVTGQYTHYSTARNSRLQMSSLWVYDIVEDKRGNLWVAGDSGVDVLYRNGGIRHWQAGSVRSMMIDSRDNLWVGNSSGEIMMMPSGGEEFVRIPLKDAEGTQISDIYQSGDQDVWISTSGAGLFRYVFPQRKIVSYNVVGGDLPSDIVRDVIEDRQGNVYVATECGLARIGKDGKMFITSNDDNLWSLNDNAVYSLYCDEDDNLWVGTFFGGVNVMYRHCSMFDFLLSDSEEYSSGSKVVSSIVQVGKDLYIGTENDGVYILKERGGKAHISASNSSLTTDNIHTICMDSHDNLWLGSYYGGLFMRPSGAAAFRNLSVGGRHSTELTSNSIYCVHEDSKGNLWIGTQYGGLYRYDYRKGQLDKFAEDKLKNAFVWDIHEDRGGDLWLACHGLGLWKLLAEEDYRPLKVDQTARYFITLCELNDGRILAGTEKEGLVVVEPITLEARKLTMEDGLPDNTVYGILQDHNNNVWLSTNSGLCKVSPTLEKLAHYTIADGLPTNRFNYNACAQINEKLYFGCINGVVVVDPDRETGIKIDRPVRFNSLYVNNARVSVSPDGLLKKDLNEIEELRLEYWQNTFSVDFSANIYGYENGQSFAYRMSGLDDDWHMLDSRHRVDFLGMKPGKYTLMVAGVDDGRVTDNVSSLRIRITPVWWQSALAKISLVLLVALLTIWLTRMFFQSSRHKHELELEKLAREKDNEINEMKFRFFVNVSHELKTPLSLILGPVEQFMSGRVPAEMTDRYFGIIKKNADKLLALVNELLAFREVQFATLKVSEIHVLQLVRSVLSRHEWLFEDKEITLDVNIPDTLVMEADAGKLEKIFDNLLSNSYKHTAKGGKVRIAASRSGDSVRFVFEDNGIGIPEEKLPYIFERFFSGRSYDMYSSGVGLSYVKSLVELHGGVITASSEYGKYTRMEILLPLKPQSRQAEQKDANEEYKEEYGKIHRFEVAAADVDYDKEEYMKLAAETVLLIVEDDHAMRELLMDHFHGRYKVICAESGESASRIVRETKVDIVVSDVMLAGGMSGFELCHYIKNSLETSHIKVVLMTVLSEQDYRYRGYQSGADAYIVKPFSFSMLELRVRNLLMSTIKQREEYKIEIDLSRLEVKASNTDEQIIRKVADVILEHLGESEFGVDDLCQSVGMSKATLYRKLKALTGQSANEFISSTRLKYSARILSETDKTISDVAYEVGFSDPYYFSRAFKKYFGKSPKQWRQDSGNMSANI